MINNINRPRKLIGEQLLKPVTLPKAPKKSKRSKKK